MARTHAVVIGRPHAVHAVVTAWPDTMAERRVAAIDLGAQSGRVGVAGFDGDRISLEVIHRFPNRPLWLPDGLHWNVAGLFADSLDGLAEAAAEQPLDGVGIDAWGCDYALLGADHRLLGLPFHYRDPSRASQTTVDRVFARLPQPALYRATGIQTMAINTVFQLSTEPSDISAAAERIALIPDLLNLWLTGHLANELTAASTTGLLSAHAPAWATELSAALGLPSAPFRHPITAPGTELGPILAGHAAAGNAVGAPVRTVAGHDTASAFAAAVRGDAGAAILSSGTWSLLGVHLPGPRVTAEAERYNLTNERAFDGSVRLLRNVMGMWLVEECRREWGGADYDRLYAAAAEVSCEVPLFDPDDASLLAPGPMVARITALSHGPGQPGPTDRAQSPAVRARAQSPRDRAILVRSILTSLACKYRLVTERLEQVSGEPITVIQVVGGGSQNELLCQLTADITQRPVIAGFREATLLGNALVQLLAAGELAGADEMRECSARSSGTRRYEPRPDGDAVYERFLTATGAERPHPRQENEHV